MGSHEDREGASYSYSDWSTTEWEQPIRLSAHRWSHPQSPTFLQTEIIILLWYFGWRNICLLLSGLSIFLLFFLGTWPSCARNHHWRQCQGLQCFGIYCPVGWGRAIGACVFEYCLCTRKVSVYLAIKRTKIFNKRLASSRDRIQI